MLVAIAGRSGPQSAAESSVSKAAFQSDGSVRLPSAYRQWVHVGTRVKVGGKNILDGEDLKTPQILNAFVEPVALASFQLTGKWPRVRK
jgi:hypothetical protein